jgi:AraC-like DNA-binding protein
MKERSSPRSVLLPRLLFAGRFASDRIVSEHSHEWAEIVLVQEGRIRLHAGDWMEGGPNSIFVLPPKVPQLTHPQGFVRAIYLIFDVPGALFDVRGRVLTPAQEDLLPVWAEQLYTMAGSPNGSKSETISALLLAVLERISEIEFSSTRRHHLHPVLARAMTYLEAHWQHPIQSGELAKHAHISESHMNALFRKHLKRSPKQCLQDLRMRAAERLLRDPYRTVAQIASECGYDDPAYFVRLFRMTHGMSPGRWRRKP